MVAGSVNLKVSGTGYQEFVGTDCMEVFEDECLACLEVLVVDSLVGMKVFGID